MVLSGCFFYCSSSPLGIRYIRSCHYMRYIGEAHARYMALAHPTACLSPPINSNYGCDRIVGAYGRLGGLVGRYLVESACMRILCMRRSSWRLVIFLSSSGSACISSMKLLRYSYRPRIICLYACLPLPLVTQMLYWLVCFT